MSSSLHTHSYFSILDGFSSPEENLKRASELKLKAVAITEHGELTSHPYYAELKSKYPNVKQLFGIELYTCDDREIKDSNNKYYHTIAIARNEEGRKAINRISTFGHLHGFYYKPRVTNEDIVKEGAENLIILTACLASKLSRTEDYNECIKIVNECKAMFPYYFLEIQAHDNEEQEAYNKKIMCLAKDTNTPVVVTNDVHAATKEDLYYQDYFLLQIAGLLLFQNDSFVFLQGVFSVPGGHKAQQFGQFDHVRLFVYGNHLVGRHNSDAIIHRAYVRVKLFESKMRFFKYFGLFLRLPERKMPALFPAVFEVIS